MRILHVTDQLSQTHGGGSAKACWQMAEAQAKIGHRVTIHTCDWQIGDQGQPEGVAVKYFRLRASPFGLRVAPGMLVAGVPDVDIIHLHNYRTVPNLIYSTRDIPYVIQPHGSLPMPAAKWKRIQGGTWRRMLKGAVGHIAIAEQEVVQFRAEGVDGATIIPPGINWREFASLPPRQPHPYKTILSLGRLHPIKGVDLLIEAFQKIDRADVRLVIAGPPEVPEYVQKLHDLAAGNPHISFVGPLYGKDKIQAYVNADLYVLPSRYEMFGITVLEALACQTKVLVTEDCGAWRTAIRGRGAVCDGTVAGLATGINYALNPCESHAEGVARRVLAQSFSWDRLAAQYIAVYERVLNGK